MTSMVVVVMMVLSDEVCCVIEKLTEPLFAVVYICYGSWFYHRLGKQQFVFYGAYRDLWYNNFKVKAKLQQMQLN